MKWNEARVGQELTPMQVPAIDRVQIVKYAGASGDFNPIHTDDETARKVGLEGAIAHGMLSMGLLGKYAGQFVGTAGFVSGLNVRFGGMVRPGDQLTCKGSVTGIDEERQMLHLKLSIEKEEGKPVTFGEATLTYYK